MMTSDGAGPHGGGSQDFDINLAPIIDCFTVLITFLLASASFLAIGIFDSAVAVPGAGDNGAKPPPVRVDVQLTPTFEIQFKVAGSEKSANFSKRIAPVKNDWNTEGLLQEVEAVQKRWPDVKTLVLGAADDVEYVHIVRLMEVMRPKVPNIMLGGY
jgi:biopolymer transport protein ExbD